MCQRDWCSTVVSTIGSCHFCAICTRCAFLNASSSVWPFSCSADVTRPHLNTSRETCSALMTTSLADHYDRRQLTSWLCVAHDSELSVIVRSVLPHFEFGTICLPTSSPCIVRRHLQAASEDLFVHTIVRCLTNCYICCYLSLKLRFTAG